jgi:MFS family permease
MVGVMNLAGAATFAILVLYAVAPGPMGLNEVGFGVLMTAMGIGSLVGSLVVERIERLLGRARLLALAVLVGAVMMAVPGLTTNAWLVGASFAASGLVFMMWNVVTVSLRQRIVPDRLLGRVNASYRLLAWGGQPIGALLGGLAGELVGLQAVFLLAGGVSATLLVGNRILNEAAIAAAERAGGEEAAAKAELASEAAAS